MRRFETAHRLGEGTRDVSRPKKSSFQRRTLIFSCALTAAAAVSGASARPLTAPAITHRLHLRAGSPGAAQQSTNWAGWVASNGGYNHVRVTYRVPTVTTTSDDRYSATWAGIGGDGSPDLIQAGTGQDSVGGAPAYYAWTEILPETEHRILGFAVSPGNVITIDIRQTTLDRWVIVVTNSTTNHSFTRKTAYPSSHFTAEWIHEAPTVDGLQANLAKTSNVIFDGGTANGRTIANAGGVDTIEMFKGSTRIATPGPLDSDGDGFAVADGSAAPPAPSS